MTSDGDACPTEAPEEADLMAMTIAELELQTKPPPPPTPPPDDPDDKKTFCAAKLKAAKKALDEAEKLPKKTDKEQRIKARIIRQTTHAHEQAKKANDHAIKFSEDFEKKKKERERGVLLAATAVDARAFASTELGAACGRLARAIAAPSPGHRRERRRREVFTARQSTRNASTAQPSRDRVARPPHAGRRREEGQGRQGFARAGREAPEGGGGACLKVRIPKLPAKLLSTRSAPLVIIGCKKQVEAALADQKKVADVEVSRQLERKVEQTGLEPSIA